MDGLDESSKARVLILKWKTDGLAREGSLAKDSTKIWNGLYCITWVDTTSMYSNKTTLNSL